MFSQTFTYFGASYDCNAYGAGAYNGSEACTTTGSQPSVVDTALAYTGEPIFIGIMAAVLIITVAAISIVYTSRRKKK